jgi:hypothetical protein
MRNYENRATVIWLFFLVLSVYILIASGHYGGDAVNNYLTTQSMVVNKSINIDTGDFNIPEVKLNKEAVVRGVSGATYSSQGIGMPLLQVPLYFIGLLFSKAISALPGAYITFFLVSFTNSFMSAFNAALLFMIMLKLDFDRRHAVYLSLAYSFCTWAIVYSKTGFSEPAQTTFMLLALFAIFSYFKDPDKSKALLVLAGASLGFMGLIKSYSIILSPLFFLYFWSKSDKGRKADILIPIVSYAAVFSLELLLNYMRFGGILKSGYGDALAVGFGYGNHFFKGLYYYWFSSGKGFFFYNAFLVLAFISWRGFYQKNKKEFFLILSIILLYVVYFAYFFKRGSIFSWGPRYLFPITPLFILFMEGLFRKKRLICISIILLLLTFVIQVPAVIMNYSRYIYFVKERLGLEEYMINFIPDLSHIKGCWNLLTSLISNKCFGTERVFLYSPDPVFIKPISSVMSGYDIPDLWYVNLAALNKQYIWLGLTAAFTVLMSAFFSLSVLILKLKKGRRSV